MWWRPRSQRCPSSLYCNGHTGLKSLVTRQRKEKELFLNYSKHCKALYIYVYISGTKPFMHGILTITLTIWFVSSLVCACTPHLHCPRTRAWVLVWCCCSPCSGCSWTAGCWPSCASRSPPPGERQVIFFLVQCMKTTSKLLDDATG